MIPYPGTRREERMDAHQAIREVARRSGTPLTEIGPRLGRNRSYVSSLAAHGAVPRSDTLARILGACGWSLVAVPRGSEPPDGVVVGPS